MVISHDRAGCVYILTLLADAALGGDTDEARKIAYRISEGEWVEWGTLALQYWYFYITGPTKRAFMLPFEIYMRV